MDNLQIFEQPVAEGTVEPLKEPGLAYAEDRVLIFPTGTSKAAQADVKPLGFFGNKQIAKTAMPLELNKDGKAESAKRIRK